jgi:hypothetical protein
MPGYMGGPAKPQKPAPKGKGTKPKGDKKK